MFVFYIAFMLIGLLGLPVFGGNPLICGLVLGGGFAGGILSLFGRGKLRGISAVLIPMCALLCLFIGQEAPGNGMEDYGQRIRHAAAQIEKGNMEEAAAQLDELENRFGFTDLSCYARADICIWLDEYDTALSWVGKVENKRDERWYQYREKILGLQGTEKAMTELEELYLSGAEALPESGHLNYMAGLVKLSRGNRQSAACYFQRAKELGEAKGDASYYLGVIRYELGDWEKALQYFEEALEQGVDQEKENNIQWYRKKQEA